MVQAEYETRRKVQWTGETFYVTLPKVWCDAQKLQAGAQLVLKFGDDGVHVLAPAHGKSKQGSPQRPLGVEAE